MTFGDEQIDRYSRQIILPQIGGRGQKVLLESTVAWFGDERSRAGIEGLTSAGVGHLKLIGGFTSELVADLRDLNPDVDATVVDIAHASADVVVTATAATRAAAQAAAFARRAERSGVIPVIVLDLDALTVALLQPTAAGDPCAACTLDPANDLPAPAVAQSLGRVALESQASALAALEVVRLLLRLGDFVPGTRLSLVDFTTHAIRRPGNCPVCSGSGNSA